MHVWALCMRVFALSARACRCMHVHIPCMCNCMRFAQPTRVTGCDAHACGCAGDGKPQLLRLTAFNQLCELLSDRLVSSRSVRLH